MHIQFGTAKLPREIPSAQGEYSFKQQFAQKFVGFPGPEDVPLRFGNPLPCLSESWVTFMLKRFHYAVFYVSLCGDALACRHASNEVLKLCRHGCADRFCG